MIIDSHIHLDTISSKFGKKPVDVDFDSVIKHIRDNNLDAAVLIYRDYSKILRIHELFPQLRIIGLYWTDIPVNSKEMNKYKEQVIMQLQKEFCYGIKLHNRGLFEQEGLSDIYQDLRKRGASDIHPASFLNYDNRYLFDILRVIPDNRIVLCHTQGGNTSLLNAGTMTKMIVSFPRLKFMIGHGGSYGKNDIAAVDPDYSRAEPRYRWFLNLLSLRSAAALVKSFVNVYIDNTIIAPVKVKGKFFNITDRVVVGTDFGITHSGTDLMKMYEKIKLYKTDFDYNIMNQRFIEWIDTDWKILSEQQIELNKRQKFIYYDNQIDFI